MTLRKLILVVSGLLMLLAVAIGLTSINHPIILKWITGSAKHHGQPMPVRVYTDGQVNDQVRVFYTDTDNNYLVSLAEEDHAGRLKFLHINLNEGWIGIPVGTSKNDYDLIAGHLFQSETGARFIPFQDALKGFDFDPQLSFSEEQIKFILPPGELTFDSVRIILP